MNITLIHRLGRVLATLVVTLLAAGLLTTVTTQSAEAHSVAYPTRQAGNRNIEVVALQHLLTSRGYATTADGIFGTGTKDKVIAFQRAQGLTADGVVQAEEWQRLDRDLNQGASGAAVKALQTLVNKFRYSQLEVDGEFGPATADAVRAFKRREGMADTSAVTAAVWQSLLGHGCVSGEQQDNTQAENTCMGHQRMLARWNESQWPSLHKLWVGESSWNHHADNPSSSAYGIPQALAALHSLPAGYYTGCSGSGSAMNCWGGTPSVQIEWGLDYIANRYTTPANAYQTWLSRNPHWYRTPA